MTRILFVCLGNICRSPLAEGILRRMARERNLDFEIDSAGTGNWHTGEYPDPRAQQVGIEHGCAMTMRARQVRRSDFTEFDWIIAMDAENERDLRRWPGSVPAKIRLARSFDPGADSLEVPDPYTGTVPDFREVATMLEAACEGIIRDLT